jgi:hypothetical protein
VSNYRRVEPADVAGGRPITGPDYPAWTISTADGRQVPGDPASPQSPTPSLFTADLATDQLALLRWVQAGEMKRRYAYEPAPVTAEERSVCGRQLTKLGLVASFTDVTGYGLKLTMAGEVVLAGVAAA